MRALALGTCSMWSTTSCSRCLFVRDTVAAVLCNEERAVRSRYLRLRFRFHCVLYSASSERCSHCRLHRMPPRKRSRKQARAANAKLGSHTIQRRPLDTKRGLRIASGRFFANVRRGWILLRFAFELVLLHQRVRCVILLSAGLPKSRMSHHTLRDIAKS